jgi:DNA invertase Pin-like site-specific DNA recombinase
MENGAPPSYLAKRRPPHHAVSGGGGDGSRSHGLKINNNIILYYVIDTGGPMGRMVLTVLGMPPRWSSASSAIGNAPALRPRRRRGFTRVALSLSTAHARIVSLRKEGMGATEIAKAVGCKRGNVYKTLKAAGLN